MVAFEIARRHRFARDLATAPDGVEVHVLPAGDGAAPRWNSREALRYRDFSAVDRRIDGAYRAVGDLPGAGRPMPLMAPKPLPPRWMRRMVLAPAMIGLTVTLLLTLPVWLLVAAAASPLLPGPAPGAARAVGRYRLARAGERVPDGAVRALARLRVRCAHADAPVPARALPPRRRVPVGVPPGRDAGARAAGGGRGPGPGRVPRPSAAGVLPARRAGRLVPAPARAGQLVRPGAAHRARRCAAVGPGDRRRAQPPAEPVPVHRRSSPSSGRSARWRPRSTATTPS